MVIKTNPVDELEMEIDGETFRFSMMWLINHIKRKNPYCVASCEIQDRVEKDREKYLSLCKYVRDYDIEGGLI